MKVKDIDVSTAEWLDLDFEARFPGFEPQLCHLLIMQYGSVTSPSETRRMQMEVLTGSFTEMRMNLENVIETEVS